MAKLFIGMVIILSTYGIGYVLSNKYVQRVNQINGLYYAIQMLETEVLYCSNSLAYGMKRVAESSDPTISKIFSDMGSLLFSRMGYTVEEAWEKAIKDNVKNTSLDKEDCEALISFGKNLGATDKENQKKNFQFLFIQLLKQRELADHQRVKNEKMYKSLGLLMGLAIVILFI